MHPPSPVRPLVHTCRRRQSLRRMLVNLASLSLTPIPARRVLGCGVYSPLNTDSAWLCSGSAQISSWLVYFKISVDSWVPTFAKFPYQASSMPFLLLSCPPSTSLFPLQPWTLPHHDPGFHYACFVSNSGSFEEGGLLALHAGVLGFIFSTRWAVL